jgi:pyruvate/2-oxoglutarate dehydrogenase complex dihydrolipoamide dehydrogenase (E3) component
MPYPAAARRVRDAVAEIAAAENAAVLRGEGIDVTLGRARFTGPGRIVVDGRQVTGRRFVVANGARPAVPPIPGLARVPYLTKETIFDLPQLPSSLAVLGGGPVGCELASRSPGSAATSVSCSAPRGCCPARSPTHPR